MYIVCIIVLLLFYYCYLCTAGNNNNNNEKKTTSTTTACRVTHRKRFTRTTHKERERHDTDTTDTTKLCTVTDSINGEQLLRLPSRALKLSSEHRERERESATRSSLCDLPTAAAERDQVTAYVKAHSLTLCRSLALPLSCSTSLCSL